MLANVLAQCALLVTATGDIPQEAIADHIYDRDSANNAEQVAWESPAVVPRNLVNIQSNESSTNSELPKSSNNQLITAQVIDHVKNLASQGNREALYVLGLFNFYGAGVTQNINEAISYYERAGKLRHVEALTNLGQIYDSGIGVPHDSQKAAKYFEQAANLGCSIAAFNLGTVYEGSNDLLPNPEKSVIWWRKAANAGFPPAMFKLGWAYITGVGVKKDTRIGLSYLQKAADSNLSAAQLKLAQMYEHGDGVAKNSEQATRMYLKAAVNGSLEALAKIQSKNFVQAAPRISRLPQRSL